MIKKNTIKSFGGLAIAFSFIGCGGGSSSTTSSVRSTSTRTTTTSTTTSVPPKGFNYTAALSKAPQIIQDAMNSQPVQFIDENFLAKLGTRAYPSGTMSMIAKPTVNGNQGYSFVTVKVDDNAINESVYAWQKDISLYSTASRKICYNAAKSSFEFSSNLLVELEKTMSVMMASALADFLSVSTITLNGTAKFIDNEIYLSGVSYTVLGQTKSMKDFNVLKSDLGILMILSAVYNDFLGSQ